MANPWFSGRGSSITTSLCLCYIFFVSLAAALQHEHLHHRRGSSDHQTTAEVDVHSHIPVAPNSGSVMPTSPLLDLGLQSSLDKRTDSSYSCDENNPCSNGACCAKTGYCGYGEASCGDGTIPNDACWSNCDAHAECGKDALIPGTLCPLNVCCSQYGFCGTTTDFCDDTCQSGCTVPSSGSSGGDVQSRIIGYYEAWAKDRTCSGMNYNNIPVGSLTHLHYSFGYIKPDFSVIPMEGLTEGSLTEFTALKEKNNALKIIVAIGGWSFNDNDTIWQPVFSNMVSTPANRAKGITNILAFLRQYSFDGVDFDWEYPGATDRGGKAEDGVNYSQFLMELQAAIEKEPIKYVVSFTAPSSYWYLKHFDLTAMMDYVDWVNVMTYDLHGEWDRDNPIGSQVLAHTNLTEIDLALDLFWRNSVDPSKVNMGLGFYGRSFELADSKCWKPGCKFSGGGKKGACTGNSGTLSYKEITQIIKSNNLTPYYDKTDAVKYIVWDNNQWVSYDDQETFQQKIEYANKLGLGGLLIWAIDLDTDDLDALKAVLYPKELGSLKNSTSDASYWQSATTADCYVTKCGGSCTPAEIAVTTQHCGSWNIGTGGSYDDDSTLCCPLSGAPDPADCKWRGSDGPCNGHCQPGEVQMETNKWGDGKHCTSGNKVYCCAVPDEQKVLAQCQWIPPLNTCGDSNSPGQTKVTWDKSTPGFKETDFCCDSDLDLQNCAWHGSGGCEDNKCPANQIVIAESYTGEGKNCHAFKSTRQRVYCCDPPGGKSPWLPVPLDYLFPEPPTGDDLDVGVQLDVDPSFGGKITGGSDEPEDAAFGFFVMASPEALQISLDKRDGSHWDVFDCPETTSEEPQDLKMVCTDDSESSNCHKIHLGHGVPGTILELPSRCGAGKYAVAIDMKVAEDQSLPHVLEKRLQRRASKPVVYNLAFDYDFRRVPRDLGDTQIRIDFSNQKGYWDGVVDKAADKRRKRKRGLEDMNGSHKRWLEDAWREDYHDGGLSKRELHERWFGDDVAAWLSNLLGIAKGAPLVDHSVKESPTVILYDQENGPCNVGGVDLYARLSMKAELDISIDTSFGFSLISKLSLPLDLSKAYVYFRNKGDVVAKFTLEALATAQFSTGDIELFGLDNFGATFRVPGIVTIGPNLQLFGSLDGEVSLSGQLVSQVKIASWDLRQTYPDQSTGSDPVALDDVNTNDSGISGVPTFNYTVAAQGSLTAHLKPVVTFGIDFDSRWDVADCKVSLTVDGFITFHAEGSSSTTGSSFCYGIDAGVEVYASVDAPSAYGWDLSVPKFDLYPLSKKTIYGPKCPIQSRSLEGDYLDSVLYDGNHVDSSLTSLDLSGEISHPEHQSNPLSRVKRASTEIGPLISSLGCLFCPSDDTADGGCPACADPDSTTGDAGDETDASCNVNDFFVSSDDLEPTCADVGVETANSRRSLDALMGTLNTSAEFDNIFSILEKREKKVVSYGGQDLPVNPFVSCDKNAAVSKWWTFKDLSVTACTFTVEQKDDNNVGKTKGQFATEHVYEVQMLGKFLNFLSTLKVSGAAPDDAVRKKWSTISESDVLKWIADSNALTVNGITTWKAMANALGSTSNRAQFALCKQTINRAKTTFMQNQMPGTPVKDPSPDAAKRAVRNAVGAFQYMKQPTIWDMMTGPSLAIEKALNDFDNAYAASYPNNPTITNFKLRQAYCYWVDKYFRAIETKAATYSSNAKILIDKTYISERSWTTANLKGSGLGSATNLKFPRSASTTSIYGLWDTSLGACNGS